MLLAEYLDEEVRAAVDHLRLLVVVGQQRSLCRGASRPAAPAAGQGRCPLVVNRRASRRTPTRHQVVGLIGVRTQTSKNVVRSWPETSSKTASKSSVVAVESS